MEYTNGKTLGRYQLRAVLGEGGMGVVYHAYDPTLQRDVAVKVMHPHLLRKPGFKERFLQEAVVAAKLMHPGIVQVHDSGETNGVLYIVMAFIPGGNLQDLLDELREQSQWVILPEAVELVQQVALALDYVHRRGVLHRDIKPGNIMLEPEPSGGLPYRPVLTDLGLAKLLEGGLETQSGASMGTPAYMSPEQAQGQAVDVRSDVYSLGALLYHLCVGRPPFPATTITEAIHYHVQTAPPPPRQLNGQVPTELESVILRALEKDPAKRFPDSARFAETLGKLMPALAAHIGSTSTAVAMAGGQSLVTVLEKGQAHLRGASVLGEFPAETPKTGVDRIQVMEPEKTGRTITVKGQVINVGRSPDSQIVLEDQKVSRHHLRIERAGSGYQVIDQGSSNGSFLGGVQLLEGVARPWDPGQPLKVGDTYLKLVLAPEETGTQVDSRKMTGIQKGEALLAVTLDKSQLTVEPGSSVTLGVRIFNQSYQVDHYRIKVEGIPENWVKSLSEQTVRCMPGEEQVVALAIQPPRVSQSRAGRYPLTILVTSQADPSQVMRSSSTLTMTPYHQFTSQLHPERIRAGQASRVRLTNQGNTPETFQLSWSDPAGELAFEPHEAKVNIEAGKTAEMEFRGRLSQARWMGGEKSHRFSTAVSLANTQPQALQGEIISRGLLPVWLIPLLIMLCVLLAVGAGGYYGFAYQPQVRATQTGAAISALNSDPDNDGLSNAEEAKIDTDPNKADTDGDGLVDGSEVDIYRTDPKDRDSDKDNLLDGVEVNELKCANPNVRDTDGDGVIDNLDSSPCELPTITPLPTRTDTPTPVPSQTNMPTSTPTQVPSDTPTPPPQATTIEINPNADIWWQSPRIFLLVACLEGQPCPTATPQQMGHETSLPLSYSCAFRSSCGSGLINLAFDLEAIPDEAALTKATLFLFVSSSAGGPGQLIIQRAVDPWDETGAVKPKCSEDQVIAQSPGNGWNELDITAIAQSLFSGSEVGYGLCISMPSDNPEMSRTMISREGPSAQQPRLRIQYEK